ncbi:MAG TPA: 1,4-alpha-glucan branching protein GlgB [Bacillaceae bacterium]|nr:1,4-alpha-glucan branching protein GlgB [Paenibacillus bovis]HLU22448.1 1,4-alpha-glucan branching protein GlgB [Bacillaceae bacterium]
MHYNISEQEIYLFHQGTNFHSYKMFGCHHVNLNNISGYRFAVWAPNAQQIHVVGDFNEWQGKDYSLKKVNDKGIWVGFFPDIPEGVPYKYEITTANGDVLLKADPYALQSELRPNTASLTPTSSKYEWHDQEWKRRKKSFNAFSSPISIYEVHLGSWKKKDNGDFYTYRELAEELIPYVKMLGYTHIELLPLAEHPLDISWGYQVTGYYAVTSRFGNRNDFKYFVDQCHKNNIGVIMDWVPGHFCKDDFGLRTFDGTPLYEYSDPRKAEKKAWGTLTFDFGSPEVQSFLISNALFWLKEYHIDGLRIDAVASMLYLNFDKEAHEERIYNSFGGEEHLEACAFIRKLNEVIFAYEPKALMMAEDSSDLPLVTSPIYAGGLGFNYKWNMGWMNDMLKYMEKDPVHRKWHHNLITFSFMYTNTENFLLPLSHDEVVHGKRSLLDKMPGDQWKQFANLRLLIGYMFAHPGKKLLFMGAEIAQYAEWKDKEQLDWHLLDYPLHKAFFTYMKEINHFYLRNKALYELDHKEDGFEWIDPHNIDQSIIAFRRRGVDPDDDLIIVCNFTPNVYENYKVGVPAPGDYIEIFNTDAVLFGGSGQINNGNYRCYSEEWHGLDQHIKIKIPPLAMAIFRQKNKTTNLVEEDMG